MIMLLFKSFAFAVQIYSKRLLRHNTLVFFDVNYIF